MRGQEPREVKGRGRGEPRSQGVKSQGKSRTYHWQEEPLAMRTRRRHRPPTYTGRQTTGNANKARGTYQPRVPLTEQPVSKTHLTISDRILFAASSYRQPGPHGQSIPGRPLSDDMRRPPHFSYVGVPGVKKCFS